MGIKIFQVDAFTDKPFMGNPAAVCVLSGASDETWMQKVAREMNLSETAFLYREEDLFNLRWFTPSTEVDLCGHATLAGAHILWETNHVRRSDRIRFHTKSGLLTAGGKKGWIELDFPADEVKEAVPGYISEILIRALKVDSGFFGKNQRDYLVEVKSEETVRNLDPDFELLKTLPGRGVMVTSRSSSKDYDFVSRFFGPKVGINEDPVCGSAHCCLTPFWSKKLNKKEMMAYQVSSRGGFLKVRTDGDRVILGGKAVTVLRGELIGREK